MVFQHSTSEKQDSKKSLSGVFVRFSVLVFNNSKGFNFPVRGNHGSMRGLWV